MTDDRPTQPTGSGKLIWRKPLTEDVIEFGTAPDLRDARIAELEEDRELAHRFGITNHERAERADARIAQLEAALREIEHWCEIAIVPYLTLKAIRERANVALMPAPERDMQITQEELDA